MSDLFDDLVDEHLLNDKVKPFHSVGSKKGEKLEWLKQVKDALLYQSQSRTQKQRMHLTWYRGINVNKQDRQREYDSTRRFNRINKFIVNHLYDLTETKVSQMTRIKPAVEVIPATDEWEDRSAAKVVNMLVKHLWTINNVDYLLQQIQRHTRIFGESFAFVTWNPSKGDKHPAWTEAMNNGLSEVQIGDTILKIDKNQPIMTGDIEYELEVPWRVLLQRKAYFNQVEYCFRIKVVPVEDLKKDYPKKADMIKDADELSIFDIESLTNRLVENHTVVFEFFHKKTKYLPEGAHVLFTNECILHEGKYPYSHGELPLVRLTDLDVPEILNGISRYETIGPIQKMYNNISTLIAKNIYLTAHAKWMMPRGACKIDQLGNENTIVQYQGPVPPTLAQVQSNPPEVYTFRNQLKEDMQTIYGSHGISRGEVPKGITAASALQFLNELENDRATTDIAKHSFLIKELAKKTIATAGDYYDVDDGRMVRIVGANNKFLIRHFDAANLSKNYDVMVDNSTGLPESKAARIQRVMDTLQRNPTLFSPERWEELLELGNIERMTSLATEATKSADSENEDILAGLDVGMPEEWEDHIEHWRAHVAAMQSRAFKEESPNEVMTNLKDHVKLTELLMIEKAGSNPLFQARLAELKLFPIFNHDNFTAPVSEEHQKAMVQGQSNKGTNVTGQIPGQDMEVRRHE